MTNFLAVLKRWSFPFITFLFVLLSVGPGVVSAISQGDINSIYNNTVWFKPGSGAGSCTGGSLIGSDNEEKTWNYFTGQGLSDAQTAGVMGNIQQESSFNPLVMEIGGQSQNPYDAGDKGWGIVQWSGNGTSGHSTGDKVKAIVQSLDITAPVYELGTQLDMVWGEMNGTSPTGSVNMIVGLRQITDPAQAATYFLTNFEAGTDPGGVRESNAIAILAKYGGTGGSCGSISPSCQSATGTARILCNAEKYDSVSYSEGGGHQGGAAWHQGCPTIGPSCVLDCSGLVNVAIYDTYNFDINETTYTEASDNQYWYRITLQQLKPGDLIQPGQYAGGHVEIVDHVSGDTIYTFGAHTANAPQPDQVGKAKYTPAGGDLYLRYVGPGA